MQVRLCSRTLTFPLFPAFSALFGSNPAQIFARNPAGIVFLALLTAGLILYATWRVRICHTLSASPPLMSYT
jgi:hypothetical protein